MAQTTIKQTSTLDITFGTSSGSEFVWKLNNPRENITSLSQVRAAFYDSEEQGTGLISTGIFVDKFDTVVTEVRAATVVNTTVTKSALD